MHPNRDGQDTQQSVPKDAELNKTLRSVLCVTRPCGNHLRPHRAKSQISIAASVSAHRKLTAKMSLSFSACPKVLCVLKLMFQAVYSPFPNASKHTSSSEIHAKHENISLIQLLVHCKISSIFYIFPLSAAILYINF